MEEKSFVWTSDITKRFFEFRFEHEWLFKQKKQPWTEFHKILLENGFPKQMTMNHIRKKWSYTYDAYRLAKKTKNKDWKYYRMFDKHFGKKVLDKYESWNDEWRLKLIICICEAKEVKLDFHNMWRTVERALRFQDLPIDCCIQDLKGLWHYIKVTFNRKHRLILKKSLNAEDWALYPTVLEYYQRFEPEHLARLENMPAARLARLELRKKHVPRGTYSRDNDTEDFQYITESFIQIRLQNDWLFRDRKWAWNNLRAMMISEYGFPQTLSSRELSRKWAATYGEYQKAKATNNKSWVYYNLLELYLGEGSLSLNPMVGWQEEWVQNLISVRTDLEHLFKFSEKNIQQAWGEVEKRLRTVGIPIDHSLLDIEDIWIHLLRTYKWKRKFANKGILNEQWPYFEAMAKYMETNETHIKHKHEHFDDAVVDDDVEDDMKLFDLKQRLSLVKPKFEAMDVNMCRCCSNDDGCVGIYDQMDECGVDLVHKLKTICGVEIEPSDTLPSQICLNCLKELENAYKFRRKCQDADKVFRDQASQVKVETHQNYHPNNIDTIDNAQDTIAFEIDSHYDDQSTEVSTGILTESAKIQKPTIKRERKMLKKNKVRKSRYDYWKICEICGKNTRNLISHLESHSSDRIYSCEVCGKKFKFKSGLIIHKAAHSTTPKKTCEVCGKNFYIMAQYRKHFAFHANERKFGCETCGKRFNSMDILRVHTRSHTDERPFSCSECGKTFRTSGCVSRHRRIVHRNIKISKKVEQKL
ncbi:uncharacterized protein LOC112050918 isoform X2 [Bicyclus anynana]|uniref:Uncharacterized protein LOC112050918 isoform X2 n=1 Tax=Bicyclus anynana TaxID=110368 RepID=A0ABM3LW20_BICAN|nr:uncharacterized protein LOC112050918 isoform X2 [Bicyclus anynana]